MKRPAAERDLIEIYKYIASEAPSRARPFLRRLDEKIRMLAGAPGVGAVRLPHYPDVRMFPIGNYLILYRPLAESAGIELIRVYHAARDWQVLAEDDLP